MGMNRENNSKLVLVDLSATATIAPAGTETNDLKPDVGFIYIVRYVYVRIPDPVGSGAGDHTIELTNTGFGTAQAKAVAAFGNTIWIRYDALEGSSSELPSGVTQQQGILQNLIASNSLPIEFKYTNGTDVNQTGTRAINVLVEKIREAV